MIDILKPLIKQFMPFAQERMGFKRPPKLFLKQDRENAVNPLGKTAFYDPAEMAVTLYVTDRHPKDVMRSLSHELVHHSQNCDGKFENVGEMGEGYAQNNDHLREMERQAYELGNMCFRDWEDSIKGTIYNESLQKGANESMSTKKWKDNELKTLLTEQWGFKMDLSQLSERKADDWGKNPAAFTGTEEEEEEEVEDVEHKKGLEESELFEQATTICKQRHEIQGDKAVRACIEETMMKHDFRSGQSELEEYGYGGGQEGGSTMPAGDLYEKHARDWGDKAGDEGSEATGHEHDTDYSGHGMRAGDESDTHPGKDFEHHDTKEGSDEDPKDLAGELLDLAHRFGSAVGVESDVSDDDEMMDIEVEEEEELEEISKRKDDPRNARAKEWPDRMRENLEGEDSEGIVDKLKKLPSGAWEMIEGILEAMADQGDPRKPSEWSDEEWKEFITTGPGSTPGYWMPEDPSGARFESRMRESLKKKFGNNAITEKQARLIIQRATKIYRNRKR